MQRRFDPDNRAALLNAERRERWAPSRFLARLNLQAGQTVLDLGCGPGFWTLPLAEIVGPSGSVWALDVSQEMLADLVRRRPPSQVRLLPGELPTIGLPDASVDWIWSAFLFHEVEPPEQLAAEMGRVTRPGGRVAVLDWRPDAPSNHGPPRSHRLLPERVGEYLQAAGFQEATRTWQDEEAYLVEAY
ncbi:MAG: methyltransferase domain-containing protein [Anaerolineae bacterium]|nr:methyltransferase domain-containing protein [Anaerolineae bacterium]